MNKVEKISIANYAFVLEVAAYKTLKIYLSELNSYYSNNSDGKEIIEGIEERIAELFFEKCPNGTVVNEAVVNEVIELLGRPEKLEEEVNNYPKEPNVVKKLYRDGSDKIIAGICSGLGAYFGIDKLIFRILFVVLGFGISFIGIHAGFWPICSIYVALWIILPEARTYKQRCQMRGESPDVNNISKNIQNGINNITSEVKDLSNRSKPAISKIANIILKVIGTIILLISVPALIGLAIGLMVALIYGLAGAAESIGGPLQEFHLMFISGINPLYITMLMISSALLISLPFVGLLYIGVRLVFKLKSPNWRPGLIIFILWVVSIFFTIGSAVKCTKDMNKEKLESFKEQMIKYYEDDIDFSDTKIIPDSLRTNHSDSLRRVYKFNIKDSQNRDSTVIEISLPKNY